MRRPLLHGSTAMLLFVAVAAPASAQRERVIRQAFEPAITPFIGASGFGVRTVGASDGAEYDYNNGFVLGLQFDRPLTRRTGLLVTGSITPLTRVVGTNEPTVAELDKTVVGGVDVGIAGRMKPGAPLFVYVGGGVSMATNEAVLQPTGFVADPRASVGIGIDIMRFERTGFRFLYLAHFVKPSSPDDAQYAAKSSALDQVFAIGGRMMLGKRGSTP